MATRELQLISRIVRTGDLSTIMEVGITEDDFLTNEGRALFSHILGYYSKPETVGSIIGENYLRAMYPTFQLCDDLGLTTQALCAEVRKARLSSTIRTTVNDLSYVDTDPMRAASVLQALASNVLSLGFNKITDVKFDNSLDRIAHKYELRKMGADLSKGSWPWQPMQEATGGIESEDYVVLYGRPKSMKSWVLAYLIAWAFNLGKRFIIYTKEMTPDNIFMRTVACIAKLPYQEFRLGRLSVEDEFNFHLVRKMVDQTKELNMAICLSGKDAPEGGDTVPWLRSKVDMYKPDFVFIDGLYLMSDAKRSKKDHERVMNISRAIRDLTLDSHTPVIATLQANRRAAGHERGELDEIAYSDAIGQDATIAMRVINEKGSPTIALVMAGSREFDLNGFRINAMPAVDFSDHSLLTEKEIEQAKNQDSSETDNSEAHVKKDKKKKQTEKAAYDQAAKRLAKMI